MKLFNKTIDKKLFAQFAKGSELSNQDVVVKIFNPYGKGTWYIINSDPADPDYLWAIVDLGYGAESGGVSRKQLETYRNKMGWGFERDLSFDDTNALELFKGLKQGKFYGKGGEIKITPDAQSDFIDYVNEFYGKKGIYAKDFENNGFTNPEVEEAVNKYLKSPDIFKTWGGGDSLDRERVRALLENVPFTLANGGMTRDRKYVNHSQDYEVNYAKGKNRHGYGNLSFAEGGYFDKAENVKFKFDVNQKIKVPQYVSDKLELTDATIVEQYPADQPDGTFYPFYKVKGSWENAGKLLYDEEKLLEYGNIPANNFAKGGAINDTDKTKLVVLGEHTLGYIQPNSNYMGILHASGLRNSPYNSFGAPVFITNQDKIRLASKKDFEDYNVSFEGYDNEDEYEFSKENNSNYANGGQVTPNVNSKVIARAEKLYADSNGKTQKDFDKAYFKAIVEFGYKPNEYIATMEKIGQVSEEDYNSFADGGTFDVHDGTAFFEGMYAEGGRIVSGQLNKKVQAIAEKQGITIDKLGVAEYNKVIAQALAYSLRDANFFEESRLIIEKLEKQKWSDSLYQSDSYNPETNIVTFAKKVAEICHWDADDILNAYYFVTKMQGSKVGNMIEDLFFTTSAPDSTKKYILHADIDSITVKRNGKEQTYKSNAFLNGANLLADGGDLQNKANYIPKRDVIEVKLKTGEIVKPNNGYWIKKDAKAINEEPKINLEGYNDISNVVPSKIETSETSAFGNPDKLYLKFKGKTIASFYYNMRGYNQNFFLKNKEGVQFGFGGEKSKSKQIADFKKAIKEGYVFVKPYDKYFEKGGETTFADKSSAIAKNFVGQKVAPEYQDEYGKEYSKAEAKAVGNKIAGAQKAKFDKGHPSSKKMLFGGFSSKKPPLVGKQFETTTDDYVQVLSQDDDKKTVTVFRIDQIGLGVKPHTIPISELIIPADTKMASGGTVKKIRKEGSGNPLLKKAVEKAREIRRSDETWKQAMSRAYAIVKQY